MALSAANQNLSKMERGLKTRILAEIQSTHQGNHVLHDDAPQYQDKNSEASLEIVPAHLLADQMLIELPQGRSWFESRPYRLIQSCQNSSRPLEIQVCYTQG